MSNATVRRLIPRALVSAVIFVPQANTITQLNWERRSASSLDNSAHPRAKTKCLASIVGIGTATATSQGVGYARRLDAQLRRRV
jgi:hypothetical protein